MSLAGGASPLAGQRIRSFSVVTWVLGSLVFVVIGLGSLIGAWLSAPAPRPWQLEETPLAVKSADGQSWSANGSALMELDDADFAGRPVELSLTSGSGISIYLDDPDEPDRPDYLSYVTSRTPAFLFPDSGSFRVWIVADGPWAVSLSTLDSEPLVDVASGKGSAYFYYDGPSSGARVEYRGDGYISVSVTTRFGTESVLNEFGAVDRRIGWNPDDKVVIFIELAKSDVEGAWKIDLEELAGGEATPNSSPSPGPSASSEGEQ